MKIVILIELKKKKVVIIQDLIIAMRIQIQIIIIDGRKNSNIIYLINLKKW